MVPTLDFAPDGTLATADSDDSVSLWRLPVNAPVWTHFLAPAVDAYDVTFSPDGTRLYAGSHTQTVTLIDPKTGDRMGVIDNLGPTIDGLAVSPDGALLAIGVKTALKVWRADGSEELWSAPANPVRAVVFSPDGQWILSGDQDGAISLWDAKRGGEPQRRLKGHFGTVTGLDFSPDGERLVSSAIDGTVKIWDWRLGEPLLSLSMPSGRMIWSAVFSPDGNTIAAAGGDGVVTLWEAESNP